MRSARHLFLTLVLISGLSVPVLAQPAAPAMQPPPAAPMGVNSVNFSPLGLLFGSYSVNFEHLMNSQHGLIAEGLFSQSSDKDSTTMSAGAAVGYRWHWSKTQDSGFLGAMLGYQTGTSVVKVVDGAGEKSFDVSVSAPSVTFNVGRRWAWSNGLNITLRFGVGRAVYSLSSTSTDPDVQDAINTVDDLMNALPVTLDGELSIGWIF